MYSQLERFYSGPKPRDVINTKKYIFYLSTVKNGYSDIHAENNSLLIYTQEATRILSTLDSDTNINIFTWNTVWKY